MQKDLFPKSEREETPPLQASVLQCIAETKETTEVECPKGQDGNQSIRFICTDFTMLLALLTFGFALSQALIAKEEGSQHTKFVFSMVVVGLSAIPLMLQFVCLVDQAVRSGRHFFKILMVELIESVFGVLMLHLYRFSRAEHCNYGHSDNRWREYVRYRVRYRVHQLACFVGVGWFAFGDPFSGKYQMRGDSDALWMPNDLSRRELSNEHTIPSGGPIGSFTRSQAIRNVTLVCYFTHLGDGNAYEYRVLAKLTRMYCHVSHGICGRANVDKFCNLLEEIHDDSFFVVLDKEAQVLKEDTSQELHCLQWWSNIIDPILRDGKTFKKTTLVNAVYI